jgi:Arc/MetJ-type ribon-helix-helix transcriptional regulator
MIITVRLDPDTRRKLDKLTRARRVSRSEVVRRAIQEMAKENPATEGSNAYDRIKHLAGSVRGLPPNLSERTGDKFYKIVMEKHRRRQQR